ncbi:multidrug resistance efflux transporter family protein [Arcobacter sp. KX21116]|jgi:drug/metabolite transporter (DMT)-like permease|uniref:DMT family transporter n=1 Tax=Arcobacter iocasae TaxID=2906515 RepID=UPI0035D4CD14
MFKLIVLGIIAGAFFSTTFVLNELMSVSGGHWLWSATLRYFFMILFLALVLLFQGGIQRIIDVCKLYISNYIFWTISGTIGFGFFYALICFSADFSPGWVIAATWQFTVVATLFVLMFFGKKFPKKIWFFSALVFLGVCLVNLSHMDHFDLKALLLGGIPILIASFCYPIGNQLVWEAKNGNHKNVPQIKSKLLNNAFNKVFLLSLGSLPLWFILIAIIQPNAPSDSQVFNTALVALFSGVFATSIFLYARNIAKDSNEIAAVDATQASEVVFALIGGIVFLGSGSLNLTSFVGLTLIMVGLFLFTKYQNTIK